MNCKECNHVVERWAGKTLKHGTFLCSNCEHWLDIYNNSPNKVVIDGKCYHIDKNESAQFKGYGGRRFKIQFLDGTFTETTNLWHNGTIPEHFLGRFPDNAKFVE